MIKIGPYTLDTRVVLAPMAGVTDQPFRRLCRKQGAALTPSEMLTANLRLWDSPKNRLRRQHDGEKEPRTVQIAGSDPEQMAAAARHNVEHGAQVIDINMGCPAKKVLKKAAGSALLKDEPLVRDILTAVVNAVEVPVTLKIRTGWSPAQRNGATIARIAEDAGIQALAVHGRTRECMYRGEAEYDTIAHIRETVSIPLFANGDITSPEKALNVLRHTGADGVMIGRGAQGSPWIFREIGHYLESGEHLPAPTLATREAILCHHLQDLYTFYGEYKGVMIARKHVGWYCKTLADSRDFLRFFNALQSRDEQLAGIRDFFAGALAA